MKLSDDHQTVLCLQARKWSLFNDGPDHRMVWVGVADRPCERFHSYERACVNIRFGVFAHHRLQISVKLGKAPPR